jgi:predicted acylesterase/phospholipase RssA/CRP-like cAMP-binding protein
MSHRRLDTAKGADLMEEWLSPLAFLALQPAFEALDPTVLQELVERLESVALHAGETLFACGDARDAIFFIMSGRITFTAQNPQGQAVPARVLSAGQAVGEIGLAADGPHSSTAQVLEDARVLRLTRSTLNGLCEKYPEAIYKLPPAVAPAAIELVLAGVVCDLLGELDAAQRAVLLAEIERLQLKQGDVLTQQGKDGDRMFVVIYGRLRIVAQDAEGTETVVDEIGRGDVLGERSLLGDVPSATVYGLGDSAVGVITRPLFENLKFQYPEVTIRLTRIALRRIQAYAARRDGTSVATAVVSRTAHAASVAVLPVGAARGDVPLAAFTERLVLALPAVWSTLHLSSARVEEFLDTPGIAQVESQHPLEPRLAAWLQQQEQSHFCVIYQADDAWTPWTERCLRMADRVLLVGQGGSAPMRSEFDEPLAHLSDSTRTMLVLLQPDDICQPSGTAAWLDRYAVGGHIHLRLGRPADFDSFMRRISGRGLGLVLGGGGARGFAHIGVFRALEECGVDVDLVGGTSMGAILSATFAMGLDYQNTMKLARQLASPLKLFDPTIPVVSFFASGKVTRLLKQLFGDTQIEDLWTPCFCVSSNLTHAVAVVHRRGPLWQAVRASMAIPGIFSPILADGDLLVDGCVLDNLPIDVMQRLNFNGPIIAVNVFPDVDLLRDYDFGPSISGWQAFTNKLNPLRRRGFTAPLIFENLVRVLALHSVQWAKTQRGFADVYICPPVEKYNILDFGAYQQIADSGYHSAMEALGEWEELPKRASICLEKNAGQANARPMPEENFTARLQKTLAELEEFLARMDESE